MLFKSQNKWKNNKGFTLVELLIVIPLISIIFMIAFNIIFISNKSFTTTKYNYSIYEDIRMFEMNIQKEANQARKATKENDVIEKINGKEIHIYTDIDGDDIPEIVRYRLINNMVLKDIKKPSGNKFPYIYSSDWCDEKIVLKNVVDKDFMDNVVDIKKQDENTIIQNSKDYRKKTILNLSIDNSTKNGKINLTILLVTKSRAEAD